jgi:hypothetical protein
LCAILWENHFQYYSYQFDYSHIIFMVASGKIPNGSGYKLDITSKNKCNFKLSKKFMIWWRWTILYVTILCIEVEEIMNRRMSNLIAKYSMNKLKMTNSLR